MARHTFIVDHGRRIEIKPSPTDNGAILLTVSGGASMLHMCATVQPSTAQLIADALAFEAVEAEKRAAINAGPVGPLPAAAVQAYADTNGREPVGA